MSSIPQPASINPYGSIQSIFQSGLDTMIAEFTGPLTIEQLSSIISGYLQSQFYPSGTLPADQQAQLDAVVGNIFNASVGPDDPIPLAYSTHQMEFINDIITFLKTASINNPNFISNYAVEEAFATSSLNTTQQAQLLIAGAITGAAYEYLYNQIISPDADWVPYLDTNPAVNFSNLPNWVVAAFRGALIGLTQSVNITPTNAPQGTGVSINIIIAMGGAFTAVFGAVLYNWVKRPDTVS
jgi:hypothetical protein